MTKPEADPLDADITDNQTFNEMRGRKMYARGEREPKRIEGDLISTMLVIGWNKARLVEVEKQRKSRHSSVVDHDNDLYKYPCDDD